MDIFVTGSTGMLGSHLVSALCERKEISTIYALIRSNDVKIPSKKVKFLRGDICQQNFALSVDDLLLLKHVSHFYHIAACVHLGNTGEVKAKLARVNIAGTANALLLCDSLPSLKSFFFISSAYAAGECDGVIPENWFRRPSKFRNFYEESKWESENLIKEKMSRSSVKFTIFRPSIMLDDSPKSSKQTIYLFAAILNNYVKDMQGTIKVKGNPTSSINLIFAQDLVKFMLAVGERPGIYNCVNQNDSSIGLLLYTISKYLNLSANLEFVENLSEEYVSKIEIELNKALTPFVPYLSMKKASWEQKNQYSYLLQKRSDDIIVHITKFCTMLSKNGLRKLAVQI